ncbi:MAG TPA: SAM-dependent methyltransferase [Amnibacterium sp.]|nr:SAM-dependent methyltransferase [Amnibacterium sp.]
MQDGQASRTARGVAAVRLHTERERAPGGDPEADDRLTARVAGGAAGDGPMSRYLAIRTRFFDRVLLRALDAGVRQVVIAAAGYDGRALRYAREGVRWFELDHPDTQRDKLAQLAALGIRTDHIHFVAADFTRDDVRGGLRAAGCDPSDRSLVLAEGIAVYLDAAVLERLLTDLRAVVGSGSRLAVSLSLQTDDRDRLLRRRAFDDRVAALGEPVRSRLTAEEAAALLEHAGWRIEAAASPAEQRARAAGLVIATATDR